MDTINNFTGLTLQLFVPIVLGALCGTIAERRGIVLLSVEGIILIGAFAGVAGSYVVGSALAGVVLSLVSSGMIGWFCTLFCLGWKAHQSVVGVGISLPTSGITAVMLKTIQRTEGMSGSVTSTPNLTIPGLSRIPVSGALFKEQSPYPYGMFLVVGAVWIVFYKTKFGLKYGAMGDQPYTVQTVGTQVNHYHHVAMIIAESIAELVGSCLSISQSNLFVVDMTMGRRFVGLTANTFSGWQLLSSMGAGIISTAAQAARSYLTDVVTPFQFTQMLPYAVTLIALLFVGKWAKDPEALGKLASWSYTRTDTKAYERSTRDP